MTATGRGGSSRSAREPAARDTDEQRQRIDRWIWHARVLKTREAAKALVEGGHVRVDGARETRAGAPVRRGQTLTITLPDRVRVLKVVDFIDKRASATVAATLFEDLSPPPPPRDAETPETVAPPKREPGSGRPTKRDRRQIVRFGGEPGEE